MPRVTVQAAGRFLDVGSSKCLSLPKELREAMGLIRGDWVNYTWDGTVLVVRQIKRSEIVGGRTLPVSGLEDGEAR